MLNPWIVNTIKDAARGELNDKDEKLLSELTKWIDFTLQKWKLEHGSRNPSRGGMGLLSDPTPIAFEDAKPWECAELFFPSRLSLAMKLISENYPDFMTILEKTNYRVVLALLIEQESSSGDDLFYAYDMFARRQANWQGQLAATLQNWDKIKAGEQQKNNLSLGNPAASKNKSERAANYHADWKKWAKETWKANPYWDVDKVAEHVLTIANKQGHEKANGTAYSVGNIKKIITGIKRELKVTN